jgi:2-oxoglutarate ferredoxin oxidoreductase subunit alpha
MIVLAPSSVQELFDFTVRAFNLAEEYRTPVIVLSETTIALMRERLVIPEADEIQIVNRKWTTKSPEEYLPFKSISPSDSEDGVPEFAGLGRGYHTVYSINPHDEKGSIEWDPDAFERLYTRIPAKVVKHRKKISTVQRYCLDDAKIALVAYGSEVRPCLDAMEVLRGMGKKAGVLKLDVPWPFPEEEVAALSDSADLVATVEMNTGKYAGEIERACRGRCRTARVTKNRGLIHSPEEILKNLDEVL